MKLSRLILVAFLICASTWAMAGDKKKTPDTFSTLHFTVIKDDNQKPVRNASVVLHPVNKDGTQAAGGFQLKTDSEGKTLTEGIPYGKLRVQVLAHGFQTFGDDFDVNQPEMNIDIRLKRPTEQLTIYGKPESGSQPDNSSQQPQAPPK